MKKSLSHFLSFHRNSPFVSLLRVAPVAPLLALCLVACPGGKTEAPEVRIHEGLLQSPRGKDFTFVRGDVIDAKTVSIDYLVGDVRGDKTRNLWINVMRGTVARGPVTINVLEGDIIEGEGVTVNLLVGEDFSGRAKVGEKVTPNPALN